MVSRLPKRLLRTLAMFGLGYRNRQIADSFNISEGSVDVYKSQLRKDLAVANWFTHLPEKVAWEYAAMDLVTPNIWCELEREGYPTGVLLRNSVVGQQLLTAELAEVKARQVLDDYYNRGIAPPAELNLPKDISHRIADGIQIDKLVKVLRRGPSESLSQDKWLVHLLENIHRRWLGNQTVVGLVGDTLEHWMKLPRQLVNDTEFVVVELGTLGRHIGMTGDYSEFDELHFLRLVSDNDYRHNDAIWVTKYYGSASAAIRNLIYHTRRPDAEASNIYRAGEMLIAEPLLNIAVNQLLPGDFEELIEAVERVEQGLGSQDKRLFLQNGGYRIRRLLRDALITSQ